MKIHKISFIFFLFLTHLFSQPAASFSAESISIASSTEQNSFSEAVVISNLGSEDLSWSLEVSGEPIYYVSHYEGTLGAGAIDSVFISGPNESYFGGIYESRLRFITNDPGNIIVDINVTVDLTGEAVGVLNSDNLDFGGVIALASKVLSKQIYNDGDDELVLSLSTGTNVFQPVSNSIVIPPQEAGDINVVFAPDVVGSFSDTLTIDNIDTNATFYLWEDLDDGRGIIKIALTGEGLTPPDIEVDLTEANFDISTGEIDTISATITNSGGTALETIRAITYFDENGDTVETGVFFRKEDYADPSLEQNQDRITDNVWLTRENNHPLYNAALEDDNDRDTSPLGTGWWVGSLKDVNSPDEVDWRSFRESWGNHNNIEGRLYTMWIYDTNLYFEFRFISWTRNGNGGGFSYERRQVNSSGAPLYNEWLTVEYQEDENVNSAVSFTKDDYADPHLEENQDRITDEIWLTRYNNNGFFNAYTHNDWVEVVEGTEWHWGPASLGNEDQYSWTADWRSAVNQSGQGGPGNSDLGNGGIMTMRVIDQPELVFEFHFHQWTCCNGGGGFSYTRYRIGPSGTPTDLIAPNSSVLLDLVADPGGMLGGQYFANVSLENNDPLDETRNISVAMNLTGVPDIAYDELYIEFDTVVVFSSSYHDLTLYNNGTADLVISDISFTSNAFSAFWSDDSSEVSNTVIPAYETRDLAIQFAPEIEGAFTASLTINSNDPDQGSAVLGLVGQAIPAPEIAVDPVSYDFGTVLQNDTLATTFTLSNNGGSDLDWGANATIEDLSRSSQSITYDQLREQYASQLISREDHGSTNSLVVQTIEPTNERAVGSSNIEASNANDGTILPPEAHRSLSGDVQIGMLMDNAWPWGMMDALSQYTTDYTLHEIYTNWNTVQLRTHIDENNIDVLIFAWEHWTGYYDQNGLEDVLNDFTGSGGHVIFTGYSSEDYGGMFPGAYAYSDWCCGYETSDPQYFDFEHPLAEGVGDYFETYRMFATYLPDTVGIDILFNSQYWEYQGSHSTFTKQIGSGRATVIGNNFDGWYEDDAIILANAVNMNSFSEFLFPNSGVLAQGESVEIELVFPTNSADFGVQTLNIDFSSNDPLNGNLIVPVTFNIDPPIISVDPVSFDFGVVGFGDTVNADITIANGGGANLDWNAEVVSHEDNRIVSQTTYEQLRLAYASQLISREDHGSTNSLVVQTIEPTNERAVGSSNIEASNANDGTILPPEAHRSLSGDVQIGVLMDNAWPWGMMDALSQYTTDYTLHEIYTNWYPEQLRTHIDENNIDVLIFAWEHWTGSYDDQNGLEDVLNDFTGSGGHVIFTGYSSNDYGGMFPGAYAYSDWCCGYGTSDPQYFDFEHPLAEGVGDYFETYRMFATYLPDTVGIDILFNSQYWEYQGSHSTFTKQIGSGRATVIGNNFDGWYEDDAIILANAVNMNSTGIRIDPYQGEINPASYQTISVSFLTNGFESGINVVEIDIQSNDPENSNVIIPISFEILPPEINVLTSEYSLSLNSNQEGVDEITVITNTGSMPLEWQANLSLEGEELRALTLQPSPEEFHLQWAEQRMPRQMINNRQDNIRNNTSSNDQTSSLNNVLNSQIEVPVINDILPREAHLSRNGSLNIMMLADNNYYGWNILSALSEQFTDYTMDTVVTGWNVSNLVENINDINPDLILIPGGHWLSNYNDYTDLSTTILDYVESGGGVLFVGENNLELSGLYDNVYLENDWCCGYNENNNEYFDEDHPILDGVGDQIDIHRFYSLYIQDDSDYEVVFNNQWWGYDHSHIIVSKAIGGGGTTYLGSAFESWYEDESIILANAVNYTARLGGFGATPRSGVLSAGDSVSIDLLYSTFGIAGDYSGALTITSNDPNNSSVEVPVLISVTGVPDITANAPFINLEDVYLGQSIGFELNVKNVGLELLQIESINLEQNGTSFSVEDGMYDLEPQQSVNVLVEFSATILGPDTATVIFNSNDPDEPSYGIQFFVNVKQPPILNVEPSEIMVDLNSYENESREIYISNSGEGELTYSLDGIVSETVLLGETISFAKGAYADWTLMENMDVISETVWLTRQDNQGIYNAYYQDSYSAEGPLGTQWRYGSTLDESNSELGYGTLQEAIVSTGYNTNQLLVQQIAGAPIFSLYLPESNEYYDVKFLTFGGNNSGGSFSWERNRVEMNEDLSWLDVSISGPGNPEPVYFQKNNWADPYDEQNQDRITDNIWITRFSDQGLINIYAEDWFNNDLSPNGTEWHWGPAESNQPWVNWRDAVYQSGDGPRYALDGEHNGQPSLMTMRVKNNPELIYEFTFLSWTCCSNGGGFSYERQQVNENGDPIGSPLTIGQIDTVTVSIAPDAIPEGAYMADLKFSSNDPLSTEFDVPITMNLTGIPQFVIWPEEVDYNFNSVYIDQSSSIDLGIYNSGTGVLTVEAALDGIYFSVSEPAMEILPYEWKVLTIHYIPEADGSHSSTLTLTTNDQEVGTVSINFSGNGLISPIAGISVDSIGVYISQQDSLTRSFEITNTGGSDLAWSLSSQSVGLDFSLEDQNRTVSEFRSQWENALIPAQNMTEAMELEINQKLAAMKRVDGFSTFSSLSKSSNAANNSLTSFQENGDFPIMPGMQRFGYPVATSILPPEAHLSRDGNTSIAMLMDNQYYAWNMMDAISWYTSDYSLDEVYTNFNGNNLKQYLDEQSPDVLIVPMGHWIENYWYEEPYEPFIASIADYMSNGGQIIFVGLNYLDDMNSFLPGQLNWGWEYYECCNTLFNDSNWDPENPIMSGIDSDSLNFFSAYTMFPEPNLIESGMIDPIIKLNWYGGPSEFLLANADLGNSGASFFGSTFDYYFEEEAKILANLIQHRASGNSFVSFEPSDGMIGVGETVTVTVKYNSTGLQKGEYRNLTTLSSNDIYNPTIQMVNNMRVVGEPSFISDNMDMDQNEVHFGEVYLMDHTEIQVVIANFDSTQLDMNFWLTDEMGEMFHIPGNDTFNIQPFTSDVLRIAVTPGHQEGFVETNLMMESNYAGMEMLSMPVRAIIVPRYEPIILNVADVPNDQGGWVTLDFTRSYFDGNFGENRTQLYTVELMSDNVWMAAVSSVAYQNSVYRALVHTLQDSGMIGDGITDFRIVAGMDEGVWVSNVSSGYSTDDIAPSGVTSLFAQTVGNNISLSWEFEGDDFYQFSVYRDILADFEPSSDNLFLNTSDFNVVDSTVEESVTYYYNVMVTDFGGNLSEPSNYAQGILEVLAVDEGLLPIEFALHQNFPNPFNPTTKINYDLPESGHVNISIYNITGRKIRSLVSGVQEAGFRSITWDAMNDIGQPVSAGMYIYTIESKDFRATRKMVLLK